MSSEYLKVRAGFIARGSSLNRWCRQQGILRQSAEKALKGQRNGPIAKELRARLLQESGVACHG